MKQVFQALARNAATHPRGPAFRMARGGDGFGRDALDWAGLSARVQTLAAQLRQAPGAPGVIALALGHGPDYVVADLAVTLAGKRLVPIPQVFSAAQSAHILRDARVQAVICDKALAATLPAGLPVIRVPEEPEV